MRVLAAAAFVLLGCSDYDLRMEMKPEGDGFARTIRREGAGALPFDVLRIVEESYAQSSAGSASGLFQGELPREFGGSGFQRRYASDLGDAWIYSELVQKSRSPWEFVQSVGAAADRCADLYLGWMRWEFAGDDEILEELAGIDADLRHWLKDLTLALAFGSEERFDWSSVFRLGHELQACGAFSLAELPGFLRLMDEDAASAWLLARLRREFARGFELEPDGEELDFLASEEALSDSWHAWLEAGGGRDVPDPPDVGSEPGAALMPLLELGGLEFDLFGGRQSLALELATTSEPLVTNGTFDPSSGVVRWAEQAMREGRVQPFYCYAAWATPDEEQQRARLGAVVLQGEELFEYALWYAGLGEDEVEQWSRLLTDFTTEESLTSRLETFRFLDRPVTPDPSGMELPHPERGAAILLQALHPD